MTYLGIVPEKLLIRFNFPTLLTSDFERARMLEDRSTPTCLSKVDGLIKITRCMKLEKKLNCTKF
jgi:hypothetical protein